MESWRAISGYPGTHFVSDEGRVKRLLPTGEERIVAGSPNTDGYVRVHLSTNGCARYHLVHCLVLQAFVGPRPSADHECDHRNGARHDNRLSNLAWVSPAENVRGADARNGGKPHIRGEKHGQAKLNTTQVRIAAACQRLCGRGYGWKTLLAEIWDVSSTAVSKAARGKTCADPTENAL